MSSAQGIVYVRVSQCVCVCVCLYVDLVIVVLTLSSQVISRSLCVSCAAFAALAGCSRRPAGQSANRLAVCSLWWPVAALRWQVCSAQPAPASA